MVQKLKINPCKHSRTTSQKLRRYSKAVIIVLTSAITSKACAEILYKTIESLIKYNPQTQIATRAIYSAITVIDAVYFSFDKFFESSFWKAEEVSYKTQIVKAAFQSTILFAIVSLVEISTLLASHPLHYIILGVPAALVVFEMAVSFLSNQKYSISNFIGKHYAEHQHSDTLKTNEEKEWLKRYT